MKKIKTLIKNLLIIFFVVFSLPVNAEEHDVVAKYNESKNIVTYESVISNGECSINIDGGTITIISNSKNLDGANVIIIKASDDALNWIKSISNTDNNYYIYLEKNSYKLDADDKIVVKFNSDDGNVKQLNVYNTSGNLISKSNDSVFSYKSNFYFSFSDIVKDNSSNEIKLNIGSNGKIMIKGTFYEGSSEYVSNDSSVKVAIIPNNGYEVFQILYNGEDITDTLRDGFVTLNLNGTSNLNIKFSAKNMEVGKYTYKISGRVIMDGKPLKNAIVILNDKEKVTTDVNGNYHFDNVPIGVNSLLIMKDGIGLGFGTFRIELSDVKNVNTYNDDLFTIEMKKNNLDIIMDINVNDDYSIELKDVKIDNAFNLLWVVLIVIGIVAVIVIFLIKKKIKSSLLNSVGEEH